MTVITTNDLTEWVMRDGSDVVDATNVSVVVDGVNAAIIDVTGRDFATTTTNDASARRFRPLSPWAVFPDDFWTNTGLIVRTDTTGDGTFDTTWATNDYELHPLNGIEHGQPWPYTKIKAVEARCFPFHRRRASVEVTAAWGWADVPAALKAGVLIYGGKIFKRKDSPLGAAGFSPIDGDIRIFLKSDPDFIELVAPYSRTARKPMVR